VSDAGDDLVAGLASGDERAFRRAYDRYADRVYSFAVRLTGRRDTADELFQHAWLRLAERARELAPDRNLLAWLLRVMHNHWRSQHRRASTHQRHRQAIAAAKGAADRPDVSAERRALLARVESALEALDERHREVLLVMIEADDVPQQELAAVLGLEPAAFRKRLSRARRALSELLREEEP
jgi:RNA polymerase sigma-70 factor (ECF subfamily)